MKCRCSVRTGCALALRWGLILLGSWTAWAQPTNPPLAAAQPTQAQLPAPAPLNEKAVFDAAAWAFQDGVYDRAHWEFANFIKTFPSSPRLNEAILFQAQSALKLNRPHEAATLLATNLAKAGALADQFRYWEANAHLQSTNFAKAADVFALLARDYTNSVHLLEAGYGEAKARFQLHDFPRVIALLQDPAGTFQRAAVARPNDELVVRGQLLLTEAMLGLKQYATSLEVLNALARRELSPEYRWRRQYLLCRVLIADQKAAEALHQTTNLIQLATAAGQPLLQAESIEMQGSILETLGRFNESIAAYEANLADNVPPDRRRHSLLKAIQLRLQLNLVDQAMQGLETFFQRYPEDAASDVGLLTFGELQLKRAFLALGTNRVDAPAPAPPSMTNYLLVATAQFQRMLTNHPASPLAGKAWLNQGWCLWLDGKVPEALGPFQKAAALLPFSPDKAVAHFKLADAFFYLKDYTNALLHYRQIIDGFVEVSNVRHTLFDRALYQIVQASLELGDLTAAKQVLGQILKELPESPLADRAMLLVAQNLNQAGRSAEARAILSDAIDRYSDRQLLPEFELAMARTYVQDQNWSVAIVRYENWISRFTNSALLPRAEFNRAWANDRAGRSTNAFLLFTNFVAKYPDDPLSPRARFWIGDFFSSQKDFVSAQINYQDTNLLASDLSYLARMRAGQSAFWGERWKDAMEHFQFLVKDSQCPPDVAVEARFALGDTFIRQEGDPEKPQQKYMDAIVAFSKIPQLYPEDPRVANAWGRIGDCYYSMGALDPTLYDSATNAFHKAIAAPNASLVARSQAEVKLAMTKEQLALARASPERTALLDAALNHYLNVVYAKNAAGSDVEQVDPFWIKEAGLAAAKLAEDLGRFDVAINLYKRLTEVLPPLEPLLAKRIERARGLKPPGSQ